MKPFRISIALLVVSLLFAPALFAQAPTSESQGVAALIPAASAAEVPRLIKFSGTLLDAQDRPMAGPVGVTFALYSQQTAGAALWMETQNVKPDATGVYTVLLGANSANGVPAELFASGEARWLEVQAERQTEQPRVLLVSVPYALKAGDAQTLGGKPASAFVTNETVVSGSASAGTAAADSSSSSSPSISTASPTSAAQTTSTKASSGPQPLTVTACTSVTSDGNATANSVAKFTAPCKIESSGISENGTGQVGIGIAPSTPAKLSLTDSQTNFSTKWLQKSLFRTTATSSGGNVAFGLDLDMTNMLVSTGVIDSGSRTAFRSLAFANNPGFAGTLNQQFGLVAQAGIFAAANTAKVTNAYGGQFTVFNRVAGTTITNAYGVFISNSDTTGTITNRYDLYASSANANNFFAGKVGIGTQTPAAKLDVEGNGGVLGHDTNTAGMAAGVTGVSDSTVSFSAGVLGNSTATTGGNFGVHGITASSTFGAAGVRGEASGANAFGVVGFAAGTSAIGVDGFASATTGSTVGTRGTVNSPGGFGVFGENNASTGGVGVQGLSSAPGGFGVSGINNASTGGVGVSGVSNATSGQSIGVSGLNTSTGGIGVGGFASATTGSPIGTRGIVSSPGGTGVLGMNNATTGGAGISGISNALAGTAALLNNTASGNIVIGQAAGVNKFRVDGSGTVTTLGNAYLATAGSGVILKSPNGLICTLFRIDNTGNPTFTTVICPAGP